MPDPSFTLFVLIVLLTMGFAVVNGFNDAANAIAPAIGARSLSSRNAVIIAAIGNMAGACTGTAVAHTIGKGILIPEAITFPAVIAALAAIIIWGTLATYMGLPISLHHGFIAGLAAAGMAVTGMGAVVWGVMGQIMAAVIIAPVLGFAGGYVAMIIIYWIFRRTAPERMRQGFARGQYATTAFMAYSHGKNDGQMPIGVIAMAMVVYFNDPTIWDRLSIGSSQLWWVIVLPAAAISIGTAMGGWRVIKTMGTRVTRLRPVQGFTTQAAAGTVIEIASFFGIPVSTTHLISASTMGVGATERFSAVRWGIAGNIVTAWILTFPICGVLGYLFSWLLQVVF
ncbi:MAG: inorganic phosphate transporter [Dehalococcoidales bacterium]|nr:inorganic phosphate transporter [Dehalococcoidales bacterium]